MANNTISQIQIGGTTYDICDATARNAIGSDTVSGLAKRIKTFEDAISINNNGILLNSSIFGPVISKHSTIDCKVNPGSVQYTTDVGNGSSFQLTDKNGKLLGYFRACKHADGRTGIDLRAWNSDTNGNNPVHGAFQLFIDRSGQVTYSIYHRANFRDAIGLTRVTQLITANSGIAGGDVRLMANDIMATVNLNQLQLSSSLANNSSIVVGTVPSAYRPYVGVFAASAPTSTNIGKLPLRVHINSGGAVTLQNFTGAAVPASQAIDATITYVL